MEEHTFKKNEDIIRELQFLDADEVAIPLDSLVDYAIKVYFQDGEKTTLFEFAKVPTVEQKPIEVVNNDTGDVLIRFDRSWTKDAEAGSYFADVSYYLADANFEDGKRHEIIDNLLFVLED